MAIYLIDESKNYSFHFSVNPIGNLSIENQRRYKTADILNYGEVDIFKQGENIKEISFDTLFPLVYDSSFCISEVQLSPQDIVSLFESWQLLEQPLRLIITDRNINTLVNLSKFKHEERAGEVGDIYATLTFRTHRATVISTVNDENYYGGLNDRDNNLGSSSGFSDGDKVKVTASLLNVRDGPGTTYNVLGSLANGKQVEIYKVYDNWADIYFGNNGGYICLDYVTKV